MPKGLSETVIWRPDNTITKKNVQERFEDAKWAIRSRNLKTRQHNNQKKKDKKGLKMPKGLSEAVIWRSDNTITKRKRTRKVPFWHLQTFLVLFLLVILLSGLQITASDSPFGIFKLFLSFFFWLLCCLAFKLRLLVALLASSNFSCPFSFGYCVVWPSNYGF
jgi:hypothetical protein